MPTCQWFINGAVEPVEFDSYEALHNRFQTEVFKLWKEEERND